LKKKKQKKKKMEKWSKFVMMKFKKRFSHLPFHSCDKCEHKEYIEICRLTNIHECKFVVKLDVYLYVNITFNIKDDKIGIYKGYGDIIKKECNGYSYFSYRFCENDLNRVRFDGQNYELITLSEQTLNVINQKPQMAQYISNLIHEVYYTDFYILLLEKYFTFLLIFRFHKPFGIPYDVAKIIAQKILFFLFCFIKQIKN